MCFLDLMEQGWARGSIQKAVERKREEITILDRENSEEFYPSIIQAEKELECLLEEEERYWKIRSREEMAKLGR